MERKLRNEDIAFIYNREKAMYFIRNGHDLVRDPGKGKTGRTYYPFKKDEKLLQTTQKWNETMAFIAKIRGKSRKF